MKRIAVLVALAGALACTSEVRQAEAGPRDAFFYPVGMGVLGGRLLVASTNADLTYDSGTGGSVIAVVPDPDPANPADGDAIAGAMNVQSFGGELGIADPAACPALGAAGRGAAAILPVRGSNLVYRLDLDAGGVPSCAGCEIPVGSGDRGDPYSVAIACDPAAGGIARAFVGHLRGTFGRAWLTQIDLALGPGDDGYVRHQGYGGGQIRGMAYDAVRQRLYFTRTATGSSGTLAYLDLAGGCRIDAAFGEGGCRSGETRAGAVPAGLELRSIALANDPDPASPVRRAYVTARIYDAAAAASAGARVGDFDGLLLVVDLAEDLAGRLDFRIVDQIPMGRGASDVHVLPSRAPLRDVVVALAQDDGVVWIYDDETGGRVQVGRDPATGAPLVGRAPAAVAVDPAASGANVARVYVSSFREHFVTPIDVPLDDPEAAAVPLVAAAPVRIGPKVTP